MIYTLKILLLVMVEIISSIYLAKANAKACGLDGDIEFTASTAAVLSIVLMGITIPTAIIFAIIN